MSETNVSTSPIIQKAIDLFGPITSESWRERGGAAIHRLASVHDSAEIFPGAIIGCNASIGANCKVGAESIIHPFVTMQDGSKVMRRCIIGMNVSLWSYAIVDNDCTIQENTTLKASSYLSANVKLGTAVRIGEDANIGDGCEIASMVHIPDEMHIDAQTRVNRTIPIVKQSRYDAYPCGVGRIAIGCQRHNVDFWMTHVDRIARRNYVDGAEKGELVTILNYLATWHLQTGPIALARVQS